MITSHECHLNNDGGRHYVLIDKCMTLSTFKEANISLYLKWRVHRESLGPECGSLEALRMNLSVKIAETESIETNFQSGWQENLM